MWIGLLISAKTIKAKIAAKESWKLTEKIALGEKIKIAKAAKVVERNASGFKSSKIALKIKAMTMKERTAGMGISARSK